MFTEAEASHLYDVLKAVADDVRRLHHAALCVRVRYRFFQCRLALCFRHGLPVDLVTHVEEGFDNFQNDIAQPLLHFLQNGLVDLRNESLECTVTVLSCLIHELADAKVE